MRSKKKSKPNSFIDVPSTAKRHFLLHFYAAIFWLLNHMRCLNELGGGDLKDSFEKYPFLAGYFAEMSQNMPKNITWEEALGWWEREITAWEKTSSEHLPLQALADQEGIDFRNRIALMIIGLVEEDSRFGTLFAKLQEPLAYRRPCLELVGQMVMKESFVGEEDPWSICRPLLSAGLVDVVNKNAPRSEWVLHVPSILWDVVRGEIGSHQAPWCHHYPLERFTPIEELIFPETFLSRLNQVPTLVQSGKAEAIVLRGTLGSERHEAMGAVALALGQGIVVVNGSMNPVERHWERLGPLCSMTQSMPVITYDLGPGETAELPLMTGYKGPVGVLIGFEGGLRGSAVEKAITMTLPSPKLAYRIQYWKKALAGHPVENLPKIGERFHMPGGYIRQAAGMAVAHAALDRRKTIQIGDVREACRALNRQLLDALADRLEVEGSWNRLIVSEATASKLREVERRCRHRERLLENLGPGFGSECNCGVRGLFTGVSGTGKTLAAKILAAELGMDLYRVDLAAVVNKYIGETEKNLHRVLSRAEELDVILLIDEGDALLGHRTEVKSANDRYANLETDYLLQKLENYQGIVFVTTNAGENIDNAFQRRMDVVVNFVPPQAQERWHIWQLHLPEDHVVDFAYLEQLSVRCAMTGGQIRNAALLAILLAIEDNNGIVSNLHLEKAIQSEYRKAGAVCPLNENGEAGEYHDGMKAFFDSLLP